MKNHANSQRAVETRAELTASLAEIDVKLADALHRPHNAKEIGDIAHDYVTLLTILEGDPNVDLEDRIGEMNAFESMEAAEAFIREVGARIDTVCDILREEGENAAAQQLEKDSFPLTDGRIGAMHAASERGINATKEILSDPANTVKSMSKRTRAEMRQFFSKLA